MSVVHDEFTHVVGAPYVNKRTFATEAEWRSKTSELRQEAAEEFLDTYVPYQLHPSQTSRERLPDVLAHDKALSPLPDDAPDDAPRGLYLYGRSGYGKTRCAAQVAVNKIMGSMNVAWWNASDLKSELFEVRNDPERKRELIEALSSRCNTLVLEDFGNELSSSFAETLRIVLEHRGEYGPIITTMYSLNELVRRFSGACGMQRQVEAIARRLFEGCRFIPFRSLKLKTRNENE